MKKFDLLIIISLLLSNARILRAQDEVEDKKTIISFSFGLSRPKLALHHDLKIEREEISSTRGHSYSLSVERMIKKKWAFRTELGWISTVGLVSTNFEAENGLNITKHFISSWTHNDKIHLGLITVYSVFKDKHIDYFLYGGLHFANDVNFTLDDKSMLNPGRVLRAGISLGNEFRLKLKAVSPSFKIYYQTFQQSKIKYSNWPGLQYHHLFYAFSVGYTL